LENLDFIAGLVAIWDLIGCANKYIEDTKPWNLKKESKTKELESFIAVLIAVLRAVAREIEPFMPQTAALISAQIKPDRVSKGAPLFPRIDVQHVN
jgi:methionyl-tRNA synthetase